MRELNGIMERPGPSWEKRLAWPVDIYPDYPTEGANYSNSPGDGRCAMSSAFLEIQADEGATGLAVPFNRLEAFLASSTSTPRVVVACLEEENMTAIETRWVGTVRHNIPISKGSLIDGSSYRLNVSSHSGMSSLTRAFSSSNAFWSTLPRSTMNW